MNRKQKEEEGRSKGKIKKKEGSEWETKKGRDKWIRNKKRRINEKQITKPNKKKKELVNKEKEPTEKATPKETRRNRLRKK